MYSSIYAVFYFIKYQAKDYVPDAMKELAEALANPLASIEHHREMQLRVLTEDERDLDNNSSMDNDNNECWYVCFNNKCIISSTDNE
jgi:hypothetical protein